MSIIVYIFIIVFLSIPIFILYKLIESLYKGKSRISKILGSKILELIYMFFVVIICIVGFTFTIYGVEAGQPLTKYENGGYENSYSALSFEHMPTVLTFFILGLIAYAILSVFASKLPPIIYAICCSFLIINVIFTVVYYIHTQTSYYDGAGDVDNAIITLRIGLAFLSLLYVAKLKCSLNEFILRQRKLGIEYENRFLSFLHHICLQYYKVTALWAIVLFPVLMAVQLILVIFGQQPDSFIRVFLDTSSFNYSKINPPPPIIISGDGHYLCTVSVKGHKKVVKPLRAGIRRGNRILVNRQLLVANAFENILEQYTPRLHKAVRYVYDKYGYPISKHINSKLSADLIYIAMKPLELIFVLVLYTVDKDPENRINIQYSELRK